MKFRELARRLIYVHKCASCRRILDMKDFDQALCSQCREHYGRARVESCPQCLRSAEECTCQPRMLSAGGSLCLRKLFFYYADKDNEAQNKLVYFIKHQPNKRIESFIARELWTPVSEELAELEIDDSRALLANVPRGKKAILEYGFDQSARICRALSAVSGIPYAPLIKRRYGGREQKRLTAAERKKNMRALMLPDPRYADLAKDKYVILFDDVVTTGASMAACLPILRKMGVKGVICCALATDIKKKRAS